MKFNYSFIRFLLCVFTGFIIISCQGNDNTLFQQLETNKTGITFSNNVENTPDFNILNYLYFYDGGGVSIGDINNDSLPDIYFTANALPNKLYLNKGNFIFEDITEQAGVSGTADWTTGTTMADVNGDGLLDIYVSAVNYLSKSGRNELFINNGDLTFTEQARHYGLDFKGYSKQASFFDYDNDGDLDMYLLNHAVHSNETFSQAQKRLTYNENAGDKLFRNDDGWFTETTKESGIYSSAIGYGLAATVSDINKDGCLDIYVSNDFHEQDYLYLNNCNGTFREVLEKATGHTSRASMGSDIADFNNDGWPDIFVLDMLPYDEKRLKSSVSSEPYTIYNVQRNFGYHPQLIRNTLQLNRGSQENGTPLFSEISQLAGVNATDWSWSSLFFDMNNDGKKDLFISNGIYHRPNNLDYIALRQSDQAQQVLQRGMSDTSMSLIRKMPQLKIPNAGFLNVGNFQFEKKNKSLGFDMPSYSNGTAYGDLDNDGDLDLVVNNINSTAFVYQNMTREKKGGNYLKVRLQSNNKNTYGIGGSVSVYANGRQQLYEVMPSRGFLSSVEPVILAGLDNVTTVDSLTVKWPDNKVQTLKNIEANQTLVLNREDAMEADSNTKKKEVVRQAFVDVSHRYDTLFYHRENAFIDYEKQLLAPHKLSTEGPRIAVADINNDGLDDFYIGGAKHQSGSLFVQDSSGSFQKSNVRTFEPDKIYEDVDAVFFDANNDGAQDLYVVSGGNEYSVHSNGYEDRLYFNDGKGNFVHIKGALPRNLENGAVVSPADFDGDGDTDLFVGSRSVPRNYGYSPNSFLLINDGTGRFTDGTDEVSPELRRVGMVTDAEWQDVNGDNAPDLIVAGEWMPVSIFMNEGGTLIKKTASAGLAKSNGWWNTIEANDFDRDGDIDFIAGNLGLNSYLKASEKEPLILYLKDFNDDGQTDPVIARTENGNEYPIATRDELLYQFKFLRDRFRTYADFAGKTVQQIFGDKLKDSVTVKKVYDFRSSYFENNGKGVFTAHPLSRKAQFAPITSMHSQDFDNDGTVDVLAGGNFYGVKPALGGQYDASYGWYLKRHKNKGFQVQDLGNSGFVVQGQIRDIKKVNNSDGTSLILVAKNNQPLLFYKYNQTTNLLSDTK